MRQSTREIEVKLPFDSAGEARARLERIGARAVGPREFEDNVLFDRPDDPLGSTGKLLRLRRTGERSLLTLKVAVEGTHRHKVREEIETHVEDHRAMVDLLRELGFVPGYRYQKYRTVFSLDDVCICLDETALGCFVELEGPPDAIDRTAERLGFTPEQYVCDSYPALHRRAIDRGDVPPGDLLVESSR